MKLFATLATLLFPGIAVCATPNVEQPPRVTITMTSKIEVAPSLANDVEDEAHHDARELLHKYATVCGVSQVAIAVDRIGTTPERRTVEYNMTNSGCITTYSICENCGKIIAESKCACGKPKIKTEEIDRCACGKPKPKQ